MKITPLPPEVIQQQVSLALEEDIGPGDVTAKLIPSETQAEAHIISREAAVICGVAWVENVFSQLDNRIHIDWQVADGEAVGPQQLICSLHGPAHSLLSGERTALNFLQTLSATATLTHHYVDAIAGTGCRILDTRKTIPGLRLAQKYAVRCGGGENHRSGLYDMVLIKENHIHACGSIKTAVETARRLSPELAIEVEVENLEQLQQALDANADRILLDNMEIEMLKLAVKQASGKIPLEASGGVNLQTVREIAQTGVDYISVGAVTKNIKAVDLSMRFI